ncbi:MAG: HD domain-containing protein, partial [Chloroflexi bacterium]|nr:HD domain-containing protein [Chloroflexota bacterium]
RLMAAFVCRAALGLENTRLFDEARRRLERPSSLHTIDKTSSASMDLSLTTNVIAQQVQAQLEVDAVSILVHNLPLQSLWCAARRGFDTVALEHTDLRVGSGLAGQAALNRRIFNIDNLAEHPDAFSDAPELAVENFVSYWGVPLIAKGEIKGVLEIFHRAPLHPNREWQDFLKTLAGQAAIAIDNATLFTELQTSNQELRLAYDTTLEGWARALEMRDMETEGHSRRVTQLAVKLAASLGMDEKSLVHVQRGALLHDIGKMGIPDAILQKPGPLTDEEWEIMRQHPVYAYEWLSPIDYLRRALDIPYCHHEKWDGSGYPRDLLGEQIPLPARIFAVIDVWDALLSDRPYREAWKKEKVIAYIREQSGKHFDPRVVEAFLKIIEP